MSGVWGCLGNNKLKVEKPMDYEIPRAAHLFDRPTVRLKNVCICPVEILVRRNKPKKRKRSK